jgi:hypothetical protein
MHVRVEILDETLKASLPGALAGVAAEYAVVSLVPVGADRFSVASTPIAFVFERTGAPPARLRLEIPHQQPFEFSKQ